MTPAEVLAALKARITNREGGNVTRVPDDDLRTLIEIAEAVVRCEPHLDHALDCPGLFAVCNCGLTDLRAALARLGTTP